MSLQTNPIVSHFSSIQAFQAYFRDHDELFVPANQSLQIQNISILTKQEDDPFETKEIFPEEISQLALYILCKMVMPLAKTVEIEFDGTGGGRLGVRINEHFSLSCSKGMTLKTQKATLYVRLTDLFKNMVTFSIPKVELAPHQKLIVLGVIEAESQPESTVGAAISKILRSRIPAGFKASFEFEGQGNHCQVSSGWATYGGTAAQRSFTIQSSQGWALTLCESKNFVFSIDGFRRRMKIKGEWKIPANQILRIEGGFFGRLQEEYARVPFAGRNFGEFALNQILLPLGKTIKFIGHGTQGHDLKWGDDFLEISSPDGLTLETGFGDLYTTLTHLGELLIADHLSVLVLQPQQRLLIYGLSKAQKTELDKWVESNNKTTIMEGLATLFMPYNPVGFVWNLKWTNHIYVAAATWEKHGPAYGLMVSSSETIWLELDRASGEWLALNLINNSSPALLQSILDADEKAFIYILFKAIFYHCCDDFRHFRSDELPGFFKKSTQDALQDLLKNNPDFTESLRLVLGNSELHQQLSTILRSSPEEFSRLDFETFPAPLKTLMNTLMKLVYEELKGSSFIAQCVQIIAKGLADGSLKGFIRPPPVPKEGPAVIEPQSASNASSKTQLPTSQPPVTPVGSGAQGPSITPIVTPPENSPQKTPIPIKPNSNALSVFVSFFWSTISRIARFVNWLLRR